MIQHNTNIEAIEDATEVLTNATSTKHKRKAEQQPKWGEEGETEAEHLAKKTFLNTQTSTTTSKQHSKQPTIDKMKGVLKGVDLSMRQIVLSLLADVFEVATINRELNSEPDVLEAEWEEYNIRKETRK